MGAPMTWATEIITNRFMLFTSGQVMQTPIRLPLRPAGLPGKVRLSASAGGSRIRLWRNADRTGEVVLPKEWNSATNVPSALYVEGVANSAAARDITLALAYDENPPNQNNPLFKCEDRVRLTVVQVDLAIGSVPDADEESVGGFIPVNADNDNGSTVTDRIPATRDFDTDGYTDDDLVSISLSLQPSTGLSGTLRLRKVEGGRDRIKVWVSTGKATEVPLPKTWTVGTDTIPATLYVEGLKEGQALRDIDLFLEHLQGGTVLCDTR